MKRWNRKSEPPKPTAPPRAATPVGSGEPAPPAARPVRRPVPPVRRADAPPGAMKMGRSVHVTGDLAGHEDMIVDGGVDGKVLVRDHALVVGAHGRITGDIHAHSVTVVGSVVGTITATDKVEVVPSGSVEGDITAPKVALAEGAQFKGHIDMGSTPEVPEWVGPLADAQRAHEQRSAPASPRPQTEEASAPEPAPSVTVDDLASPVAETPGEVDDASKFESFDPANP